MVAKKPEKPEGDKPPKQPLPDFGAYGVALANARQAADLTLDRLAEVSGVARRQLIDIEHGKGGGLRSAHALAHALGVPMDELLASLCDGHEPPRRVERPARGATSPGRSRARHGA